MGWGGGQGRPSSPPAAWRARFPAPRPREVVARGSGRCAAECAGSKVWPRAAPGAGAECHPSLLSGIRSVSGPPAAFAFPATDTGGRLHFLPARSDTFSFEGRVLGGRPAAPLASWPSQSDPNWPQPWQQLGILGSGPARASHLSTLRLGDEAPCALWTPNALEYSTLSHQKRSRFPWRGMGSQN